MQIPFQPTDGVTVNIAATTTSGNLLVTQAQPNTRQQVRVTNSGTTPAFIKFGSDNTVTATATADIPLLGGQSFIFSVTIPADGQLWAAVKMGSGTATVYFTPGVGIS